MHSTPMSLAWQFSGGSLPAAIMDLLELREVIEPMCARMAAERATTEEIAEIERALLEMERSVGKTTASVEADLLFHLTILEATHNSFMRPFGALIQAALRASFRQTNRDTAAYQQTLLKHRMVLTAIKGKNPGAAQDAMRAVLTRSPSRYPARSRCQSSEEKDPYRRGQKHKSTSSRINPTPRSVNLSTPLPSDR